MSVAMKEFKKVTTHSLQQMKDQGEKISMLTAYDFTMAKMVDAAGVDCILVGEWRVMKRPYLLLWIK